MALCTTIALSVAQNLLATLESLKLKNIPYFLCYKSMINALQESVKTVKDIFINAEGEKNEANETQLNGIKLLKDYIYDVDDLIDEFVTIAELKQHMSNKGWKTTQKVRTLFSSFNHIAAYKISLDVKKLRKKLDVIPNDHSLHKFRVENQVSQLHKKFIIKRKNICLVNEGIVIGREEDHENIVSVLIDSDIKRDISFLTIVGMGGIGKTTLAKLVYDDERVTTAFDLKLWTRVFNNEHEQLGVEIIDCEYMRTISGYEHNRRVLTKEKENNGLGDLLLGRKYLLILDDVLIKNSRHWRELDDIVSKGCKGSWILVTTRLYEIPRLIEGGMIHKLEGLSKDKSWELFKMMAFGSKELNKPDNDELVTIQNEIVERCAGVPLAIRVAGSLLYGTDKSNWLSLYHKASSILRESQKDILPLLRLSYDNLEFPLKSCFTYCALFPKDYVIKKEVLKNLWMAQGYIVPFDNDGQTIDDIAEEYFSILLRRCFFQDVEYDECGGIISCKINNLIHDMVKRVVGNEICVSNIVTSVDCIKVRHLTCVGELKNYSFIHNHPRSFLCFDMSFEDVGHFLQSRTWMWLRALKLTSIKTLSASIGDFIHLRYLDLSRNEELEVLPLSIVNLYNLQTLKLGECRSLRKLPHNLNELRKLRVLDIEGCNNLNSMPRGMDKLTNLCTLSTFLVSKPSVGFNQLNELKELNSLKGKLYIKFPKGYVDDAKLEGDYLKSKEHLDHIIIHTTILDDFQALNVLEKMQPHPDLKVLEINNMEGCFLKMPTWVKENNLERLPNFIRLKLEGSWLENNLGTFLPNLVRLNLFKLLMDKSSYIGCLGNLPHLKELTLSTLQNLEYIFESSPIAANSNAKTCTLLYPSLEILRLINLLDLQEWRWRSGVVGRDNNENNIEGSMVTPLHLSLLKELTILDSPKLISIFQCPVLENLTLKRINKNIQVITAREQVGDQKGMTSNDPKPKLNKVTLSLNDLAWLKFQPLTFYVFPYLEIRRSSHGSWVRIQVLPSLRIFNDVFHRCSSSLQYLSILECTSLESIIFGGLEHLTVLKELNIFQCEIRNANKGEREDGTPWRPPFHHSLSHLTLNSLSSMVELPKWIQFLTSLQTLKIQYCTRVESLPNWMSKLNSLKVLNLWQCSEHLNKRCQESMGEDWPFIQHIPFIVFDRQL